MNTKLLESIPVLPSSDINRDAVWYKEKVGFELLYNDNMYAVLKRDDIIIREMAFRLVFIADNC